MNTIYFVIVVCHLAGYFTENCVNYLDAMMLTLFFFKLIFPVAQLIGDIIEDLLGKC